MAEQIDLKKAVTSPFTGLFWVKTIMYAFGIGFLVLVGFAVYKTYIKKPLPTQAITVGEGGHVTIKNEANKRSFILFAEPYIGMDSKDKGSVGIRTGARWEF